jgi:predicted nucleic acid-binding protein
VTTPGHNVVDSSAWLEFLADGPNAAALAPAIEAVARLVVPTLVMTEVLRQLEAQGRREVIPEVLAHMRQGRLVPLEESLAVEAAGTVWTQDEDFNALPGVEYRPHRKGK